MAREIIYQAVSPVGGGKKALAPVARRLDSLNGKTIGELSSKAYNEHVLFPIIRETLKKRYPDIKFVTIDEVNAALPHDTVMVLDGKTAVQTKHQEATIAIMRRMGCDAVIVGNGG